MESPSLNGMGASPIERGDATAASDVVGNKKAKDKGKSKPETSNLNSIANTIQKLEEGKYVSPHILKKHESELKQLGYDVEQLTGKAALTKAMRLGKSQFSPAKPASKEHLQGSRKEKQPFPKQSLTRMITGDVKPEWLLGLGRMKADKVTPAEGYKDVFVSSLEEYEKKGINFNSDSKNDPAVMAEKLNLKEDDLAKIKNQGAWLVLIHPGSKLAIPTERKSEWNPRYIEGGYTGSDQQEWVTPNVGLDAAVRAKDVRIFKIDSEGNTVEWKFFQGKLMPEDEWEKAIEAHVSSVSKKSMQQTKPPPPVSNAS